MSPLPDCSVATVSVSVANQIFNQSLHGGAQTLRAEEPLFSDSLTSQYNATCRNRKQKRHQQS
jgi:hypothetical protein